MHTTTARPVSLVKIVANPRLSIHDGSPAADVRAQLAYVESLPADAINDYLIGYMRALLGR